MNKWVGKVALVTGASSGLGAAIAQRLVENGMKVVGCARNLQQIESMAESLKDSKGSLTAIQCDVSKEDQILSMFAKIKNQYGGVDVCINNAGLSHNASLLTGNTDQWKSMFDINVLGLMICSREAVKSMRERNVDDGQIFLMNSMSGHRVLNNQSIHVYAATKFAVKAITDGLRNELTATGSHIRVTSISPGLVETNFFPRMHPEKPNAKQEAYKQFQPVQAEDIADAVIYSLSSPVRTQIHDILIRPTESKI